MRTRWAWFGFCLVVCAACTAFAYLLVGSTVILPALLLLALLSVVAKRKSRFWAVSTALTGVVILTAIGVAEGFSTDLLLMGVTAGLASWDLMLLQEKNGEVDHEELAASPENYHVRLLAVAVGTGWLLATLASRVKLDLPFAAVAALAAFVAVGLGLGLRLVSAEDCI